MTNSVTVTRSVSNIVGNYASCTVTSQFTSAIDDVSDPDGYQNILLFSNSETFNDATKGRVLGLGLLSGTLDSTADYSLYWEATTPVRLFGPAYGSGNYVPYDFRSFGGFPNPGGAGATGNIILRVLNTILQAREPAIQGVTFYMAKN